MDSIQGTSQYDFIQTPHPSGRDESHGSQGNTNLDDSIERLLGDDPVTQEGTEVRIPMPDDDNSEKSVPTGIEPKPETSTFFAARKPDSVCPTGSGNTGNNPVHPTPVVQTDNTESEPEVMIVDEIRNTHDLNCSQCDDKENGIGTRHYFTHVRTIAIIRDELLTTIEADYPRSVDNFTVHNKFHLGRFNETYNVYDQPPHSEYGRTQYWKTPEFLIKLFRVAEKRLSSCFPFKQMDTTLDLNWQSSRLMIGYKDTSDNWVSIQAHSITAEKASLNATPKHDQVTIVTKKPQWVDSIMYVWFYIDVKKLSIPRRPFSIQEDQFMSEVRYTLANEKDPLKILLNLLMAYDLTYSEEANKPQNIEKGFEKESAQRADDFEEDQKDLRKSVLRRKTIQKVLKNVFNGQNSNFRDGSLKPPSTLTEDSSLKLVRKMKRKEINASKQTEMIIQATPPCKRKLTFAPISCAKNARGNEWRQSTSSSQSSQSDPTTTPKSFRFQSGDNTQPGNQAHSLARRPRSSTPVRRQPLLPLPKQDPNVASETGFGADPNNIWQQKSKESLTNRFLKRQNANMATAEVTPSTGDKNQLTTQNPETKPMSEVIFQSLLSKENELDATESSLTYTLDCLEDDAINEEMDQKQYRKQAYAMKKRRKQQEKRRMRREAKRQ